MANVKLIFENGSVANLTASRISNKDMRKIRVFEKQKYISIDLLNKQIIEHSANFNENKKLIFNHQNIKIDNYDALAAELMHFYNCIINNDTNLDNISNAIEALKIAQKINDLLQNSHADEEIKLAVMSTLLNNSKNREEDIKKRKKLN